MENNKAQKISAGNILIAEPFMTDGYFKRSVILVCEHRVDGSVGFILNKTVNMNIGDLISDFPEFEATVNFGGPVSTDTIHYIHNVGDILDGSTEIVKGVYWGGDFEKLKFLIKSELILPKNIRFFVGYSGWSAGQLEEELQHGSWVIDQMYANYAFKEKQQKLWQKVLINKGETYTVIAQMKDFHYLN